MPQKTGSKWEITSFLLHLMGMFFMLLDHLWVAVIPGNDWMTCLGRLALPIFAFLTVEGYFHTKNLKKYVGRLLVAAVLSEIPFDLVAGGSAFYPLHQNVLWVFLIAIGLIHWNEHEKKNHVAIRILVCMATLAIAFVVGVITMVDYTYCGIFTVLVFYYFRGNSLWHFLAQLLCLWHINSNLLGGFSYEIALFGHTFSLARQSLALLALIPIRLYRGTQGHHSKAFQYICYAFYPAHLLLLGCLKLL